MAPRIKREPSVPTQTSTLPLASLDAPKPRKWVDFAQDPETAKVAALMLLGLNHGAMPGPHVFHRMGEYDAIMESEEEDRTRRVPFEESFRRIVKLCKSLVENKVAKEEEKRVAREVEKKELRVTKEIEKIIARDQRSMGYRKLIVEDSMSESYLQTGMEDQTDEEKIDTSARTAEIAGAPKVAGFQSPFNKAPIYKASKVSKVIESSKVSCDSRARRKKQATNNKDPEVTESELETLEELLKPMKSENEFADNLDVLKGPNNAMYSMVADTAEMKGKEKDAKKRKDNDESGYLEIIQRLKPAKRLKAHSSNPNLRKAPVAPMMGGALPTPIKKEDKGTNNTEKKPKWEADDRDVEFVKEIVMHRKQPNSRDSIYVGDYEGTQAAVYANFNAGGHLRFNTCNADRFGQPLLVAFMAGVYSCSFKDVVQAGPAAVGGSQAKPQLRAWIARQTNYQR